MAIQINGKKVVHLGNMTIPIIKGDIGPEGKQGKQGIPGIDGKDGQTPLRGIDYWTTEDKNEIINEIDTKVQNDLQEYYKKTETYNKEEIDNKISLIPKFDIEVVDKLPTSNISEATVYLVKSGEESQNLYTEYIYTNGKWEQLGTQKLDLSGFYNKDEINSMLATRDSKITALEEENRSQADRIKELEEEVEILSGDYKESTVEGESVVIADGLAKSKIKADINGNSYQETTEGYNRLYLFKNETATKNGVTAEIKENEITLNGTSTSLTDIYLLGGWGDTTENEKRKIKAGKHTLVNYGDSNIVSVNMYNGTKILMNLARTENIKVVNFTEDTYYSVIYISIPTGTTLTNFKLKLGLLEGAYTLDTLPPYEPYTNGASPNIEYKQDIEVIDTVNIFDGEVELGNITNGENSTHAECYRSKNYQKVKPNTNYAFGVNGALNKVIICMYDKDKNYIGLDNVGLLATTGLFTTYANAEYIRFRSYAADGLLFASGKIQINEGTTLKPYLPYGHIGLIQRGKNRLKFKETTTQTNSGLTGTANVDGSFKLNGTTTGTVAMGFNLEPYKVKGTHRASGYTKDGLVQLYWKDKNGTVKYKEIRETTPINFEEGDTLFQVFCWTNKTGTAYNNETFYLQLEEGSEATPFEPPVEPKTIEIDLAGESLAKVRKIADLLNIGVDGRVSIDKNTVDDILAINRYRLNRETDTYWNIICENALHYNADGKAIPSASASVLCNYFRFGLDGENKIGVYENNAYLMFPKTTYPTYESCTEWIESHKNDIHLLYKLTTPTTISLPSIEPITLFEGTNVFELVTNLGTTMKVEYKVSNKKKILNLEERISALESAVIGG